MLGIFERHCFNRLKSIIDKHCNELQHIDKIRHWIIFVPNINMIANWNRGEIEELLEKKRQQIIRRKRYGTKNRSSKI